MQAAPPASNAREALALVCQLIEEVEDESCPLPREEPPPYRFTGRMYAPKPDQVHPMPNGGLVATTLRHPVHCFPDDGVTIVHIPTRRVKIAKEGGKA